MAKEIPIIIKVDGKEVDLAKTSINEFQKIYTEAQKKLNDLPLGQDEWKKLNSELKNADKTFNQTKEILNETEGKFKSLRVQIRQATVAFQEAEEKGDIKSMKKLKKDLDDLNDQLEVSTLKSMEFKDALATMPGIAGFVGQSLQGLDKAFKVLVANPFLATVTALVGAFTFLKEALSKTTEGQNALNKVSQAFSTVMGPLLALINTVAVPIFEKLAFVIGKVGQGFAWVAEKLGVSKDKIAAATKDVDKVGQEAAKKEEERQQKLKEQKEKEIANREKAIQKAQEEAAKKKKASQDQINDDEAVAQSETELARAKVQASNDEIQAIKDKQAAQDQDFQRETKRINDLMKLEKVGSSEYKKLLVERNNLEKDYLNNKATNTKELNKLNEDRINNEKELNDKIIELQIELIKDEKQKDIASVNDKLRRDLETLEKDKAFIAKSETEKEAIRKLYRDAAAVQVTKINDAAKKKEEEDRVKKLDDELKFLQIKGEVLTVGTRAYFENQREILNAAQKRELEDVTLTEEQRTAIEEKYQKLRKQNKMQEAQTYLDYSAKIANAISDVFGAQASALDKEAKTSKEAFDKRKKFQKQSAKLSAAAALLSLWGAPYTMPPLIEIPLRVIQSYAIIKKTDNQIKEINSTEFEGSGGGNTQSAAAQPNLGKNYEKGGMIGGKRHAQGGTLIEAEQGEAIMSRGSVTMFGPLLSAMNQMGGGTSFIKSAMTTSPDNAVISSPATEQSPIIVKSYVVSSDMTSTQEKNARLKDLSTL